MSSPRWLLFGFGLIILGFERPARQSVLDVPNASKIGSLPWITTSSLTERGRNSDETS